jgi:CAAX amino terminal protease family.
MFRSVIVAVHLLAKVSPGHIVLVAPLYFGIAHIHHFYEFRLTHPDTPVLAALLRSLFQFGFTTVFGWYATFVFLRTGSLPAVILIHSFCNWCGLPRLWGPSMRASPWDLPWSGERKTRMSVRSRQEMARRALGGPLPITSSSLREQ